MPDHEDPAMASRGPGNGETQHPSRRSVLRGAAGAGAAGVAATVFASVAAPALAATRPAARGEHKELTEEESAGEVVVHVRNARSGEIDLFRGTSHTRLQDRELAARLIRASR
jgi:hypothetical protein